MNMVFDFVQTSCVIIVLAYLLSRMNVFSGTKSGEKLPKWKIAVAVFVSVVISLYGTFIKPHLSSGLYVDTRVAGITLPGLLLGALPSFLVLVPTMAATVLFGESTMIPDLLIMALSFLLSVLCHKKFPDFDAVLSGIVVGALEVCHMLLIVLFVRPVEAAKEIIYSISFPMIVVNGLTAIIFVLIITDMNDRRRLWEKEVAAHSEFSVAKRIQTALLDKDFDVDPRISLSAFLEPAYDVGGDLYSFYLDKGRWFKFIIGDVSGKGVPASITMSRCETLFQELVLHTSAPSDILDSLNKRLCCNNRAQMFVTAFAGVLDLETGELSYSNAGHVTPYLVEAGTPAKELPRPKGKPLGIVPNTKYEDLSCVIKPGQFVVSYTDGVTEAEDSSGKLFGSKRLEAAISDMEEVSPNAIQNKIISSVKDYANGAHQSDDIAIFCFGIKKAPLCYEIENDISAMLGMLSKIDEDLKSMGASENAVQDIELVLEEVVSNIINYGYSDKKEGGIAVSLWPENEKPVIQIKDDSEPFDPFEADSPAMKIKAEKRSIGGLGIYLTKNRVVSHSYNSENGYNILSMEMRNSRVER